MLKSIFERLAVVEESVIFKESEIFTSADIGAVCAQVAQFAFEKELSSGQDYKVATQNILLAISQHKPTLEQKDIEQRHEVFLILD